MVIPNIGFRCWNLTTGECTGNIDYDVPDPINYQTVFTNDENYVLVSTGKTNILIDMTKNKVLKEFNPWYTTYKNRQRFGFYRPMTMIKIVISSERRMDV